MVIYFCTTLEDGHSCFSVLNLHNFEQSCATCLKFSCYDPTNELAIFLLHYYLIHKQAICIHDLIDDA
jgi:hypothetical protein